MTTEATISGDFCRKLREVRNELLDLLEAVRPDLYRYCRSLAGSPWDAEDLVQETLVRAWSRLSMRSTLNEVEHPRAYLFRIATNVFLDDRRRGDRVSAEPDLEVSVESSESRPAEVGEALEALALRLPPRERSAVLLKDVFGYSIDETAGFLETSTGAVKAALFRGRRRLREAEGRPPAAARSRHPAADARLQAFVDAFNARDLDRLMSLFETDARAEIVGCLLEEGRGEIRDGSMVHTLFGPDGAPLPEHSPHAGIAEVEGEPLVVLFYRGKDGEAGLGDILRFEHEGEAIRRLRYYYFSPDVLSEIADRLGVPANPNGYRY